MVRMKVGADRGEKLTEIKEEQFGGILGAIVPARNEKIGTEPIWRWSEVRERYISAYFEAC